MSTVRSSSCGGCAASYTAAMSAVTPIQALFAAITLYLRPREPWTAVVDAIAAAQAGAPPQAPSAGTLPDAAVHGALPVALDLHALVTDAATQPVLAALGVAAPWLRWQRNTTYRDADFLRRYAYCELLGPSGIAQHASFSAGLLYLAPRTFYPPHAHPAEEAYHVLAGHGTWQQGHAAAAVRPPGARVLHPPHVPHAMRSDHTPLLALYQWRGDITAPARFID